MNLFFLDIVEAY